MSEDLEAGWFIVGPDAAEILGDGKQSKSYIHIDEVIEAVLLTHRRAQSEYDMHNVATGDCITVREITDLAVERLGLDPAAVQFDFTGSPAGWKGDVPFVRLDTRKIRALGWAPARSSREALSSALEALLSEARAARAS